MKTKTYNVYTFDELSDEQKQKAIENYREINTYYDWWNYIEEDFNIELNEFDLYHRKIEISFKIHAKTTAEYIIENHGQKTDSYVLADEFIKEVTPLYKIYDGDIEGDELENEYNIEKLEKEFLHELAHEVFDSLQKEYDYITSDEGIVETFKANDYEFTTTCKID